MTPTPDTIGHWISGETRSLLSKVEDILDECMESEKTGLRRTLPFEVDVLRTLMEASYLSASAGLTAINRVVCGYMSGYYQDTCLKELLSAQAHNDDYDHEIAVERYDDYSDAMPDVPGIHLEKFILHCGGNPRVPLQRQFYGNLYERCFDKPMRMMSETIRQTLKDAFG